MPKKNNPNITMRDFATPFRIFACGVLSLILLVILSVIDKQLTNTIAANGIISFELSGSLLESLKIISSWNSTARIFAGFSLGIDYFFLFAYALFFFSVSIHLAWIYHDKNRMVYYAGMFIAFLQPLAGLLDAIENYALFQLLTGSYEEIYVTIARYLASIKFVFIGLGIIYILLILMVIGYEKFSSRNQAGFSP